MSQIKSTFFVPQFHIFFQAAAVWKWWHCARTKLPSDKPILLLNMDETSVAAFYGHQAGNVVTEKGARNKFQQYASRNQQRVHVTHACFICNQPHLAHKLPQLLLVNKHTITIPQLNQILDEAPANVYVKRVDSAWMNEKVMCVLLNVLHQHLRAEWDTYRVVLLMDAFKGHVHRNVALQCNRFKITLIVVPAKLTWLMQPCDTHLFVEYKRKMRRLWQEVSLQSESGTVNIVDLFRIVFATIEDVVQGRSWVRAFKENGFHSNFGQLSKYIMDQLELEEKPAINTAMPSLEDLSHCYPRRAVIPENIVMKSLRAPLPALPPPPAVHQALGSGGLPRALPLVPRRSLLAAALAPPEDPWRQAMSQEESMRGEEVNRPVTRSMSLKAQTSQEPAAPLPPPALPPKRRELPWKRRLPG